MRSLLRPVSMALCALPALLTAAFVVHFATPVPLDDIWNQVQVLDGGVYGHSAARALWTPHNEHRIPIARIVLFVLDKTTRMSLRLEALVSFAVLALAVLVLFRGVASRHARNALGLLAFAPVPWMLFSWRAQENLLKSFQIAIHLYLVFTFVALLLLDDGFAAPRRLGAAIAAAALASFSFGSGLLVWPAGLFQIGFRNLGKRPLPRRAAAVWAAAGALTIAVYFIDYHPNQSYRRPSHGLRDVALYFFAMLGSPYTSDVHLALLCGGAFVVLAAFAVSVAARSESRGGIGLTLLVLTLAGTALVSLSRAGYGPEHALLSRYVTLTMAGAVGAWLVVAELPVAKYIAVVLLLGTLDGYRLGLHEARAFTARFRANENAMRHLDELPDQVVLRDFGTPLVFRLWINYIRCNRLSIFRRDPGPAPTTYLTGPAFALDLPREDDVVLQRQGTLAVSGWAYDALSGLPSPKVESVVDGGRVVPLRYGLPRPDIAAARGDPKLRNVGFSGELEAARLGAGVHQVEFRVWAVDPCLAFRAHPFRVTVR